MSTAHPRRDLAMRRDRIYLVKDPGQQIPDMSKSRSKSTRRRRIHARDTHLGNVKLTSAGLISFGGVGESSAASIPAKKQNVGYLGTSFTERGHKTAVKSTQLWDVPVDNMETHVIASASQLFRD